MQDVTEHFRGSGFKVFAGMIEKDPKVRVWAIPAPGRRLARLLRPHELLGARRGPAGPRLHLLARRRGRRCRAPSPRTSGPSAPSAIRTQLGLKDGDAVFFAAGNPAKLLQVRRRARATEIGAELKLIDEDQFALGLDRRLPVLRVERGGEEDRLLAQPVLDAAGRLEALDAAKTDEELLKIKAYQYDIVCNGFEIASGGIRNHKPDDDGQGVRHRRARTGGRRAALRRPVSAPSSTARRRTAAWRPASTASSCCWSGAKNLREVALFPMNQQANDLLMGAPSEVAPKQLRELSIRVVAPE